MPKLGEAFVVIRAALGPLKTGLASARSLVGKAMSTITNTVKKAMSITYTWVKRAMLAIGGAVGASLYAFSKFEEQMANVSTMLDEHTMKYMPGYSKAIKKMAVDFGESTATLSKGLYDILSASIAPAKAMIVLEQSVKAAKAGMTDTGTAADAITTILNSYNLVAEDAARVSDILFAIVKRGKTTFAELAPVIGRVTSIASTAGLSLEEVGAAIATMTRAGLKTDVAITALRAIMTAFLKPMESAKKVAAELGIELNTASLQTIGLTGVLRKLKGASAEQLAGLIPNVRALAGFAASLQKVEEQAADVDLMLNSMGMTQTAYEKMTRTFSHTLNRLKESFKILAVEIGNALSPAFEIFSKVTIDSMKKAIEYIEKHKFEIMRWSVIVATRINMVRGIMQDFVVGAVKNWPETWKFIKEIVIANMDAAWKSMIAGLKGALSIAVDIFVAFGKTLYEIFKKIFIDIGGNIVVWFKRGWAGKKMYQKEFDKEVKRLIEGKGGKIYETPMGPKYSSLPQNEIDTIKKQAEEYAKQKTYAGRYLRESMYPSFEGESWFNALKKSSDYFADAYEKAKEKIANIKREIEDISQKMKMSKTPEWLKEDYQKRLVDMYKQQAEWLDKINKLEKEARQTVEKAGPVTKPKGGVGALAGAAGAAAGKGLGFIGAREAWREIAMNINKSPFEKELLDIGKAQLKELQTINEGFDELETLGTVS